MSQIDESLFVIAGAFDVSGLNRWKVDDPPFQQVAKRRNPPLLA